MRGIFLAIILLLIFVCSLSIIKDYCKQLIKYMIMQIKKLALHILLFSWVSVVTTFVLSVCYAYLSAICSDLLSANIIGIIKGLLRSVFGVDSAFAALQIFASYSILVSFVSCLILSVGVVVGTIYRVMLRTSKIATVKKDFEVWCDESKPSNRFKVYLKYNS